MGALRATPAVWLAERRAAFAGVRRTSEGRHNAGPGPARTTSVDHPVRRAARGADLLRAGDTGPGSDPAAAGPVVLDLDLLPAHRVAHRLGLTRDVRADPDLLDHPGRLRDHRLLTALDRLDG